MNRALFYFHNFRENKNSNALYFSVCFSCVVVTHEIHTCMNTILCALRDNAHRIAEGILSSGNLTPLGCIVHNMAKLMKLRISIRCFKPCVIVDSYIMTSLPHSHYFECHAMPGD